MNCYLPIHFFNLSTDAYQCDTRSISSLFRTSKKIAEALLGILFNKIHHAFRHYWRSVLIFDITEGHLSTLMFVDLQFGMVNVSYVFERYCGCVQQCCLLLRSC